MVERSERFVVLQRAVRKKASSVTSRCCAESCQFVDDLVERGANGYTQARTFDGRVESEKHIEGKAESDVHGRNFAVGLYSMRA